jgi:mevalonyl-CoA ligase
MTETSPASFMTQTTDTLEQRLETVGRVLPHVSAKVVDAKNRILPLGTPGELCISGWLLQRGYYKNPEKTAEAMIRDDDGVLWMHTGDEATIDEDGYCRITGRIKDIIIRGKSFCRIRCSDIAADRRERGRKCVSWRD